ncbi:hypothetical protein NDU88_005590 [Pleurodeles waltl]|uniref:Uncharacterized protein n=1 Tax=Pleurodeles waltl TaxID=8319 RepID=A0AAV7TB44_PLEWA|nr:hypothetical protein NDU88_005590 [Pleurodeles waltl]
MGDSLILGRFKELFKAQADDMDLEQPSPVKEELVNMIHNEARKTKPESSKRRSTSRSCIWCEGSYPDTDFSVNKAVVVDKVMVETLCSCSDAKKVSAICIKAPGYVTKVTVETFANSCVNTKTPLAIDFEALCADNRYTSNIKTVFNIVKSTRKVKIGIENSI